VAVFAFGNCRGQGAAIPTSAPQLAPGLPHAPGIPAHKLADPCLFSDRLLSVSDGVVTGFIPGAGTRIPRRSDASLRQAGIDPNSPDAHPIDFGLPVAGAARISSIEVLPEDIARSTAVVAALDIQSQGGGQLTAVDPEVGVRINVAPINGRLGPPPLEEDMAGNVVPLSVRQAVAMGRQPNFAVNKSFFGGIIKGIGRGIAGLIPGGRTIVDIAGGLLGGGGGRGTVALGPTVALPFSPGCPPGFESVGGRCLPQAPTVPATRIPGLSPPSAAGMAVATRGISVPAVVSVPTHKCPRFGDGKTGILWMNGLSGEIVCIPRGVNGRKFGLVRKNPPRAKAFITRGDINCLRKADRLERKAIQVAKLAGLARRRPALKR